MRDVAALVTPLLVGAVGSIPTARSIPTWYRTLDKPAWNPPDAVFGPVWTTLYILMGIALTLVRRVEGSRSIAASQATFGVQLALNLAWSFVFFGKRDPRGALVVIGTLWISILATIMAFRRVRPSAALLLLPYLGWVSFAAMLNGEIARRNPA